MLNLIYNRVAPFYDILDLPFEILFYHQMRAELLNSLRNQKILEIGVGTGANLQFYHPSNTILATDISEKMIRKAQDKAKNFNTSIDFEIIDGKKIPLPACSIDIVVATFVIYLQDDPTSLIAEIHRVLKSNGELRVMEYNTPQDLFNYAFARLLNTLTLSLYGLDMTSIQTIPQLSELYHLQKYSEYLP